MTTSKEIKDWRAALDASRGRTLKTCADGEIVHAHAAAARMVAAWTLAPVPRDPVRHLEAAHDRARHHLGRLLTHDPNREVLSAMTGELFERLTAAQPAPLTAPAGVTRYTYTPRKILRRVLDHALDHLNQIDQWLTWRREHIAPTPTDGWAPSTITLPDDRLPLAQRDLDAWLWRIDQAARLMLQRAAGLTESELDWQPPDGGWPLRRVLHHVARSELLYSAALDEALPAADSQTRYVEAGRRLDETLNTAVARGEDASIVYAGLYGVLCTPEEVVNDVLVIEEELLAVQPPSGRHLALGPSL
jgi:DinB family protein